MATLDSRGGGWLVDGEIKDDVPGACRAITGRASSSFSWPWFISPIRDKPEPRGMQKGRSPTFLVCGVERGGTTYLYDIMKRSDTIYVPYTKELNYFRDIEDRTWSWYIRQFECRREVPVGEISPLYYWHTRVPRRISERLPSVKLVLLLRDPIDRAYSNYKFNINRHFQNPSVSFDDAIMTADGFKRYITKGFYHRYVQRLYRYFDSDQILLITSELLYEAPDRALGLIGRHIGWDVDHRTVVRREKSNPSYDVHEARSKLLFRIYPLISGLPTRLPDLLYRYLKDVRNRMVQSKPSEHRRSVNADTKRYLGEMFYPDVRGLSEYTEVVGLDRWSHIDLYK